MSILSKGCEKRNLKKQNQISSKGCGNNTNCIKRLHKKGIFSKDHRKMQIVPKYHEKKKSRLCQRIQKKMQIMPKD